MAKKSVDRFDTVDISVKGVILRTRSERAGSVHFKGKLFCCRAVFPQMKAKGRVITIIVGLSLKGVITVCTGFSHNTL
jgi:hypothetical protein